MRIWMRAIGVIGLALLFQAGAAAADAAGRLKLAITAEQVDWERCAAFADGQLLAAPPREVLAAWLGLGAADMSSPSVWTTGPTAGEVRHFRVVFKQPIEVGTLCCPAEAVAVLRDAAALPGDLTREADWQALPRGQVRPLDRGRTIRAVRVTLKQHNLPWEASRRPSQFPGLWLLAGRFFNPAEFGQKQWSRATPEKNQKTPGMQWLGYWPDALPVSGFLTSQPQRGLLGVAALTESATAHPRSAGVKDWKNVTTSARQTLVAFESPMATQAVRLSVASETAASGQAAALPEIFPLVAIADEAPTPTIESFSFLKPPPVALKYEMPLDGFVAVRIEDQAGKHVRRLVAETERARGAVAEGWDLQDDDGQLVVPGTYRFVGVARPPLKLTYEMTVYNAGNPPWMAPVPGGGWWMADHAPPRAVCAVGDTMFFGASGAEFGTPLIATDSEGRKLWHDLHQGAQRLVSDGRYAYVVNDNEVLRIDPQRGFAKQTVHKFQYSPTLPGHANAWVMADLSGAAVSAKHLCVSYSAASPPWVTSSIKASEVDIARCVPSPLPVKVHVTALTPNEVVYAALQASTSSTVASLGPAPSRGPLAHTLVVALTTEVPVGSVVVPNGNVEVYALRPGKKLPPQFVQGATPNDPLAAPGTGTKKPLGDEDLLAEFQTRFDPEIWMALKSPSAAQPGIAVPEKGFKTRAVVFTSPELERLDYSMVLDRRYRDATRTARFISLEGAATKSGGWQMLRTDDKPISYGNPAIAGYVWPAAVSARGFMLTKPLPWAGIAVDVWAGADDAPIDAAAFRDNSLWRQVHLHRQTRNHIKYSWHTHKVITGDFGSTLSVRAVRIRVIDPPSGTGAKPGPINGGFEKFLLFEPLGGDAELPVDLAQRVTVLDVADEAAATAKVSAQLPMPHPSALAFDDKGRLLVACDDGVCRLASLTPEGAASRQVLLTPVVAGRPRAMAFDKEGLLYVLDGQAGCVRVFDLSTSREVRRFGKPGGQSGPYDPAELTTPVALSLDARDKVWLVEQHFQPKRISRWSKLGEVERQLFGPTHYGGGGMLDPGDRTVINHLGMKFRIDYATRTWKLESRLAPYGGGSFMPDRVVYWQKQRFLIGDRPVVTPFGDAGPTAVICQEVDGVAVPRVASGLLGDWQELPRNPSLQQAAESIDPSQTAFVWSDRNADRLVQAEEVQFLRGFAARQGPNIGDDLSLNFSMAQGGVRLRLSQLVGGGAVAVPTYDAANLERLSELTDEVMVNSAGETFVMTHKLLDKNGQKLWTYPDKYRGVQASNQVPWGFTQRPPGVVAGSFGPIGNFSIGDEAFFCVGGNNGDYYAFTRDGLLAAAILGGPRGYGLRYFSMPECVPGQTDLSDLRKTVEDFHGHVTRAEDGHVYAIAGKNHVSLMRVDGLEQMRRFAGQVEVSRDDLQRTQQWSAKKALVERFLDQQGPQRYPVSFAAKKLNIDGDILTDWPKADPLTIHQTLDATGRISRQWQARLIFDNEHLYLGGTAIDDSPMVNSASDPQVLFQHGDALDLHLGLDPAAATTRTEAVAGDIRLLISVRDDQPIAMLYRYVANADAPRATEPARVFQSPVGSTSVAEIRELKDAKISLVRSDRRWTIEAAIPWAALAVKPPASTRVLRGDLGALESDSNGQATVGRYYWSNKRQVFLGDQPAEARVVPSTWGELEFVVPDAIDSLLDIEGK